MFIIKNKKFIFNLVIFIVCIAAIFFVVNKINSFRKKDTVKIGVSLYVENDTFIDDIVSSIQQTAKEYENETGKTVILNISFAGGSQRTQNQQIKKYMDLNYDAVCVNLVERTNASYIISEAINNNVPVVFFNREPVKEDIMRGENIYYVGSDARLSAVLQGEAIVESCSKYKDVLDKNGDGVFQYVLLEGEVGHQDTILRSEYSVQTVTDAGIELEKLSSGTADWVKVRAEGLMEQWIKNYGDKIELVIANNDDMAVGAAAALSTAEIDAAVFGIDGTEVGIDAVERGFIFSTVDCNGKKQGEAIAKIAICLSMEGKIPDDVEILDDRYVRVPISKIVGQSAD